MRTETNRPPVNIVDPRPSLIVQLATLPCGALLIVDDCARVSVSHGNAASLLDYDGRHLTPRHGWGRLPTAAVRQAAAVVRARWTATHQPARIIVAR